MTTHPPYLRAQPTITLPHRRVSLNSTNLLVLAEPQIYQAVLPVTYELDVPELPPFNGVPAEQPIVEQHNQQLQQPLKKRLRPLRDGYLYLFKEGGLYAEYRITYDAVNNRTLLGKIDLDTEQGKDRRSEDKRYQSVPYLLVPKQGEYQIAYSEGQWPWLRIQSLGGLHKTDPVVEYPYPLLNPQLGLPTPDQDSQLNQWSEPRAHSLRAERFQTLNPAEAPQDGAKYSLNGFTQHPGKCLPETILRQFPGLKSLNIEQQTDTYEWVDECVLLPVQDPLLIGHQIAQQLQLSWQWLMRVVEQMKDPNNRDYPFAPYYESALLAYQLYYSRSKLPQGQTRWQQDQQSEDAFKHLSLTDLEAALAIPLRRTLYATISHWQQHLAHYLNGEGIWQSWQHRLKGSLDDYWAMPELLGPLSAKEDSPDYWGYRHRRWYHLSQLLELLGQPPQDMARLMEQDSVGLSLADKALNGPGPQLIRTLLKGTHPLSELVFNAPQQVLYHYQQPLVQLGKLGEPYYQKALTGDERTRLIAEEQTLLTQLRAMPWPTSNHYRPDIALLKQQQTSQQESEQNLLTTFDSETGSSIKVSFNTLKFVGALIGTLGANALRLDNKPKEAHYLHPAHERLRHLFNSVTDAHLAYSSFEALWANRANSEHKQQLIAEFLHQADTQRTTILDDIPSPKQQQAEASETLRQQLAQRRSDHLAQRRALKKSLRDHQLPDSIAHLNAEHNRVKAQLANNARAERALQPQSAALNEQEIQWRQQQQALRSRIAQRQQQQQWLEAFFEQQKEARKQGRDAARSLNDIWLDRPDLQGVLKSDPESPLRQLYALDEQHLAEVETLRHQTRVVTAQYQTDYHNNLRKLEHQGQQPINPSTPEGQELLAYRASQRSKLKQWQGGELTVITTTDSDFDLLKARYAGEASHVVLTPSESRLWQQQFEGNYLTLAGGQRLYARDPSQGVEAHRFRDVSIGSALVVFELYNFTVALGTVRSGKEDAKSTRNVLDLVSNGLGSGAAMADVWKLWHNGNAYANEAAAVAQPYAQVMAKSRAVLGGRSLATVAGAAGGLASGLAFSVALIDAVENTKQGDDVAIAHYTLALGAVLGTASALFSGLSFLGPIGIAISLIGVLLQYFIFKEDDLLNTWLEQGPFSEEKPGNRTQLQLENDHYATNHRLLSVDDQPHHATSLLNAPHLKTWQTSLVSYRTGLENTLTGQNSQPRKVLIAHVPYTRVLGNIVLDQNYRVLGLDYPANHRERIDHAHFWIEPNDNTLYLKQGNRLDPITVIGETLAGTRAGVCNLLDNRLNQLLPEAITSDKSVRFSTRSWDDDKFTQTMKDHPVASLELLLNGMFPIKTKLQLVPIDSNGKPVSRRQGRQRRGGAYDWSKVTSVRAIIEVDVPYFIEGQSSLFVRLTEPLGMFSNQFEDGGRQIDIYDYQKKTKDKIIQAKNFTVIAKLGSSYSEGDYFIRNDKKIVIVRDLPVSILSQAKFDIARIELSVWVRLSLNGQEDHRVLDNIWFPWRSNSAFNGEVVLNDGNTWVISTSDIN